MESSVKESLEEWAKSLVGRDWEIFWNDEEENSDQKNEAASVNNDPDKQSHEKDDDNKDPGSDNDSVGSIIDDWYAGYIVSLNPNPADAEGKVTFKVRFVGDEEIYDMALEPSKVRPSARGWINRARLSATAVRAAADVPVSGSRS